MEKIHVRSISQFSAVVAFHGHLCPGLALEYRAAEIGMKELRSSPSGDEELVAVVENDACGIDAVQVMTGCTAGKGNQVFHDFGKHVYRFISRATGDAVRVATLPSFSTDVIDPSFGKMRRKVTSGAATEAEKEEFHQRLHRICDTIVSMPAERIFSVRHVTAKIPELARIFRSVPCSRCKELVAEPKVRVRDGKFFCIPCYGDEP
jgi:formylmethanofuran dehydrogenase subunit E